MRAVHQFVPVLHRGDAVGQHTLGLRAELRRRGVASEVFVERVDPDTAGETLEAAGYPDRARPDDVLVYQLATASDLAPWLARRPEPLVVNYHNVTPASLFAPWDNGLARHQVRAGAQVHELAGRACLGVTVSEFNRADLVAAGYRRTEVVPPIVALPPTPADPTGTEPVAPVPRAAGGGPPAGDAGAGDGGRWLHVGRLAPNKAVERLLDALLVHRLRDDPGATLAVVGRPSVVPYASALHAYAAELGLAGAVRFTGRLDDEGLDAAYREADVVVVSSEHEGFCLPAAEAMAHGVPVVALSRGALPEVVGPAAILVDQPDPRALAAAVQCLRADPGRRRELVAAGRARVGELGLAGVAGQLASLLLALPVTSVTPT